MADYKQFTVPLEALKTELAELYDPKSESYSDKFVYALETLVAFSIKIVKESDPLSYIKSVSGITSVASLVWTVSPYVDVDIQYPNPFKGIPLKVKDINIKNDFVISDEKMYSALLKFKQFAESSTDNSDDSINQVKGKIIDSFNSFFGEKIDAYNVEKEFKELFTKIEEDNKRFKEEHNKIEQMFSDKADVTLIENAVASFLKEQGTSQKDNVTKHSYLIQRYVDLYNDAQNHCNDKKHNIIYHDAEPFKDRIARLKEECFERSHEVSSFEETKEGEGDQPYLSPSESLSPSPQLNTFAAKNTNEVDNRPITLESLTDESIRIKAKLVQIKENIRSTDESIKMCQEEIGGIEKPNEQTSYQFIQNIADLTAALNELNGNQPDINQVIGKGIEIRPDLDAVMNEFSTLKTTHDKLTDEIGKIEALQSYLTEVNLSMDKKDFVSSLIRHIVIDGRLPTHFSIQLQSPKFVQIFSQVN